MRQQSHSAAFPFALAEWFIKLFTAKGDVVLDPFLGSGTTAIASAQMERQYIGIDIKKEYCGNDRERVKREIQAGRALMKTLNLKRS